MSLDDWFSTRIDWLEEDLTDRDRFLARLYMTTGVILGTIFGATLMNILISFEVICR